jgi:hypothetical protein
MPRKPYHQRSFAITTISPTTALRSVELVIGLYCDGITIVSETNPWDYVVLALLYARLVTREVKKTVNGSGDKFTMKQALLI